MTPLEDDEVRDEVLEIKDRIAEEHHRGGHVTGIVAGCSICAELRAAADRREPGPATSLPTSLEDLARLRVLNPPPPGALENREAEPLLRIIRQGKLAGGDDGEVSLIEMALEAGEQALAEAENGRHSAATVTATVGVIRAVAAIDDTLRTILATIVNQQLDAGIRVGEQLDAERPQRPGAEFWNTPVKDAPDGAA